jgi:phosphatidylinositol alpha-1,6-mannosyltransferase
VYAPSWDGAAAFDASCPFPVVRHRTSLMIAEPTVLRRAREVVRAEGCTSVLYGAAAPLGLLAGALRRSGVERHVALTHGHEAAWAQLPVSRSLLRRVGEQTDVITYLGEYTRARIARVLSTDAAAAMVRLTPGVDQTTFSPEVDGSGIREQHGLTGRPIVVCVSRLMTRKGQDTLIEAWPAIRRQVPGAALLIVGEGPYRSHLERLVRDHGLERDVVLAGGVPWSDLPRYYAAGDVFAMPCRTRRGGLDVEGLGIVFLEAAATGLPVVAGDSGGAPDAVRDGETGYVVPGGSPVAVANRVVELLLDPAKARAMGERGRAWVEQTWTWRRQSELLTGLLEPR